ncbi:hypothetical protein GBAR_LOCUS21310 [Geodia barretti]|uniref:Uncharacterized protein n=1 Tax=Geodia barretti TaxID=519541 RepID=A0AA35X4W9_GEOBA|nr:hypothetical protein GBAR_LOCUS21310 [Geodia barretti]
MSGAWFCFIVGGVVLLSAGNLVAAEGEGESLEPCCNNDLLMPSVTVSLTNLPDNLTLCTSNSMTDVAIPYNEPINVTYSCQISSGTILWQLGGCRTDRMNGSITYQMVDNDQFFNHGVIIQNGLSSMSTLNLLPEGRQFLRNQLQSDVITIQCSAVVDNLNVFGGDVYQLHLYDHPCAPKGLVVYPKNSSLNLLQWNRPNCVNINELVLLRYRVTVERIDNDMIIFEATTNYTWMEVSLPIVACDEPFLFSVVATSECTESSEPATVIATIPPLVDIKDVRETLHITIDLGDVGAVCIVLLLNHTLSEACRQDNAEPGSSGLLLPLCLNYTASALGGNATESVYTCMDNESLEIRLCSPDFQQNMIYEIYLSACDGTIDVCQDLPPIPISTAQLQSASIVFFGTVAQFSCAFADNIPITSNALCEFTLYMADGSEENYMIQPATTKHLPVKETRNAYVRFMARYGGESLSPTVTVRTGIEGASAEWSTFTSQLKLSCSLSPSNPAMGCMFVMLSLSSEETLETILVQPGTSGCTSAAYEISCCDVECAVTSQARYRVYGIHGGHVDSSIAFEGNITENDQNNLCPTPTTEVPLLSTITLTTTVTRTECPTSTSPAVIIRETEVEEVGLSGGPVAACHERHGKLFNNIC